MVQLSSTPYHHHNNNNIMAGFEAGGGGGGTFAKKIRAATDSEQFDLGGLTESQVHSVMEGAFSDPFEHLSGMIRLSFVVGGGKGVRTKYDDNMPKWVAQSLKGLGFEEDKSASCDLNSKKSYKFHHDTGKNLKIIVVFPDVNPEGTTAPGGHHQEGQEGAEEGQHGEGGGAGGEGGATGGVVNVEEVCVECPLEVFGEMVSCMAPSWSQRQRLVKEVLVPKAERLEAIEQKLMTGTKPEAQEQQLYELLSGASLREKAEWVTGSMKALVDEGQLTAADIHKLKAQVEGKLESVKEEMAKLPSDAPPAAKKKLEMQRKALEEREGKLQAATPITHPLKKQAELKPLWRRQTALQQEKATIKGRLLTLPELRKFSEIDRLEDSISALVHESRTFFETDQELQDRAKVAKKKSLAGMPAPAKKKPAVGSTAGGAAKGGGWSSVGSSKKTGGGGGGAKAKGGSTNAFAALGGGDSDSD